MKKNTSRVPREKFRFLDKVYWDRSGMSPNKGRRTWDKRSLNSERTSPVKAGESIFLLNIRILNLFDEQILLCQADLQKLNLKKRGRSHRSIRRSS